jgi:hypothetical protein
MLRRSALEVAPLFYKQAYAVCSRPAELAGKQPAVLCHKWEYIFTLKRITTKYYQIRNLILKMDFRAFLDFVVNDHQKKDERPL